MNFAGSAFQHPIGLEIQSQNQQYDLESEIIEDCVNQLKSESQEFNILLNHLLALEQTFRYRVEVLDEDNSKAIFIFTVVAATFLPLYSFTSYFEMNSNVIRDINKSYSTFWAVAIPFTLAVVTLAILVAHRRDWAREWLSTFKMPAITSSWLWAKHTRVKENKVAKKRVRFWKSMRIAKIRISVFEICPIH